jgi:hypothetical protein
MASARRRATCALSIAFALGCGATPSPAVAPAIALPTPSAAPVAVADGADNAESAPDAEAPPANSLRFDGLYVASHADSSGGSYYLRFYADGRVVSITSMDDATKVARTLAPETPYVGVGKYAVRGDTIEFSTVTALGSVDHDATLAGDRLTLRWHSNINGHSGTVTYAFVPIALE